MSVRKILVRLERNREFPREETGMPINAFFTANSDYFAEIHPSPTTEDLPDGTSEAFIETLKGVMRDRILSV